LKYLTAGKETPYYFLLKEDLIPGVTIVTACSSGKIYIAT
jgi:hypothetical protein